jgi:hypothetical protein
MPALPPGWAKTLDEVDKLIENALALADQRAGELPAAATNDLAGQRREDVARLESCLRGLGEQLQAADALVGEVDQALQAAEEALQQYRASCGTASRRLAEWARCAIR